MRGSELKRRSMQLVQRHSIKPIERPALPLLPPLACPQIVEAIASSADIDAERMSFARGSLPAGQLAGSLISASKPRQALYSCPSRHPEARRMSGISIAATVSERVHNEDSASGFYFRITKARIDDFVNRSGLPMPTRWSPSAVTSPRWIVLTTMLPPRWLVLRPPSRI